MSNNNRYPSYNSLRKEYNSLKPKSWGVAVLLSSLFGILGVDRFYLGCVGTGILKLITIGGLGIWALVDYITLLVGSKICNGYRFVEEPWSTNKETVFGVLSIVLGVILPILLSYLFREKFSGYVSEYFSNTKSEEDKQ